MAVPHARAKNPTAIINQSIEGDDMKPKVAGEAYQLQRL
jgi:hypothetical protein